MHRDLKPANVMVDARGVVRITDFGLAEAGPVLPGERAREGTPAYMAPEQLAGGRVTVSSDLYALGLVLYELLTGDQPLAAAATETSATGGRPAPPPPSRLAPGLDPEVDAVILRCLAADPEQRPPSARAVADALGRDESLTRAQAEAQSRADRVEAFRAELAELRSAGVVRLEPEELVAIEKHHRRVLSDLVARLDIDLDERGRQLSLGMRIASAVGAAALAASFFYFFYSLWGAISLPGQVAILAGAPLLALLATDLIARREPAGHFTNIAALLAIGCSITDTTALGGALNLTPSPTAFLLWGALALLIAYGYELRLPLAVGLVCVAIFSACELHALTGGYWAYCASRPESFMPVGLALLLLSRWPRTAPHPGFAPIFRVLGLAALVLPSVCLGQNVLGSYLSLERASAVALHQALGFLLSALAVWLGIRWRCRATVSTAITLLVLQLFLRFAYWWWEWLPRYVFFLVVALAAVAILFFLRRTRATLAALTERGRP